MLCACALLLGVATLKQILCVSSTTELFKSLTLQWKEEFFTLCTWTGMLYFVFWCNATQHSGAGQTLRLLLAVISCQHEHELFVALWYIPRLQRSPHRCGTYLDYRGLHIIVVHTSTTEVSTSLWYIPWLQRSPHHCGTYLDYRGLRIVVVHTSTTEVSASLWYIPILQRSPHYCGEGE